MEARQGQSSAHLVHAATNHSVYSAISLKLRFVRTSCKATNRLFCPAMQGAPGRLSMKLKTRYTLFLRLPRTGTPVLPQEDEGKQH